MLLQYSSLWNFSPALVTCGLLILAVYARLSQYRLNRRSFFFLGGYVLLFAALSAPMGPSPHQHLFSLHMARHILLLMLAPPLLVAGLPKKTLLIFFSKPRVQKTFQKLFNPFLAWGLGVGIMWFWHIPPVFNYLSSPEKTTLWTILLNAIETISLVSIGLLYCWPILSPLKQYRLPPLKGMIYLFSACSGCSILGMLITFSSPGLYHTVFSGSPDAVIWGMTRQVDQQLGGLLMWVPGCFIYLSGVITLLIRWFSEARSHSPKVQSPSKHTLTT